MKSYSSREIIDSNIKKKEEERRLSILIRIFL